MEKRISYVEFQSVRSVAKAIDPIMLQKNKLQAQIDALEDEFKEKAKVIVTKLRASIDEKKAKLEEDLNSKNVQIDALEAGIVQIIGFHVGDLVKKVIEPTGKTDPKTGKPIKVTKYLPTDIVSYDDEKKQFVITMPDEETVVPPTTGDSAGSDFDKDAESFQESEEESTRAVPDEGEAVPGVSDEPANEQEAEIELPWE